VRGQLRAGGAVLHRGGITLHAPVPRPGKILCIGLNYRDHAEEQGAKLPERPLVFSKFSTCVLAPGGTIVIPLGSTETDYEAELGVVIGKRATGVARSTWASRTSTSRTTTARPPAAPRRTSAGCSPRT
jgi:2-keto-4-pentenoate hydratase/2-oxohepta-3-ene-1,7-dioic acid hydratase in catechol pathway